MVIAVACATVCAGLGVVAPAAASAAGAPTAVADEAPGSAGLDPVDTAEPERIPNRYIAIFDPSATPDHVRAVRNEVLGQGGRIHHDYTEALLGFAATMSRSSVDKVRDDQAIRVVEPDYTVDLASSQSAPSWGLDRVDQRPRAVDGRYDYVASGVGVTAYMIDTGIRTTHAEFRTGTGSRVLPGFSAIGGGTTDCNGHGTHTAATLGGATYGVANKVTLVPVRVLGCNGGGSSSDVIAGINWVTGQVKDWQQANPDRSRGFVANMSLGEPNPGSNVVDLAVRGSIAQGVTYVVAAGNDEGDACDQSPARVGDAITVGATDESDRRAGFSNCGSCVDIWAPGVDIRSAGSGSDTAIVPMTGTSMATPHVAGAAALYLQQNPGAKPVQVREGIVGSATSGVLHGLGSGSPNKLVYTAALGGVPNRPPSIGGPQAVLTGNQAGVGTVPVRVQLGTSQDPDGDGIATHQLQVSHNAGASWSDVALPSARAGAVTLALPAGSGLRLRDRAIDSLGNAGGWSAGGTRALVLRDQGGWSFRKSSKWKTRSLRGALGNSVRRSKAKNSTARLRFSGRQIAWIATMAKDRGKAAVYLDGKRVATVDLYRSSTSVRRLVFLRTNLSSGSHTLKVVVLGKKRSASKASYVDVDGWTTLG